MADNQDNIAGTQLQVDGADEFIRQVEDAKKAITDLGDATDKAGGKSGDVGTTGEAVKDLGDKAKESTNGVQGLLTKLEDLPFIGEGVRQLAGAFKEAQGGVEALSAATDAGMGLAGIAIAAVIAAVAALVVAIAGANESVNALVEYGGQLNDLAKVMGVTAQSAEQISVAANIAGVSTEGVSFAFQRLNMNVDKTDEKAAAALNKTGGAASDTAKKIDQLTEDHIAKIAEAQEALAERILDIQANLAEQEAAYQDKRQALEDNRDKSIADARAALSDQLTSLAQSHADKVASINQSLADEADNFGQGEIDRAQKLQDTLTGIEDTFAGKRDAVNAKYLMPKSAREFAAKAEELAALDAQETDAKNKANSKALTEEEKAQAAHDKKVTALQMQLDKEAKLYEQQTEKLQKEEAKREAAANDTYDKQVAAAEKANEKQIAAAAKAQAQIEKETNKRLDAEDKAYQRALDAANVKVGGAAADTAKALSPVDAAFKKLGITMEEWNALTPDQQILRFGEALKSIKDPVEKMNILSDIFGRRKAAEMAEFFEVFEQKRELGLQLTSQDLEDLEAFKRDQREMDLQFQYLGMQIGQVFFPIWRDLLAGFKEFWHEHGPAITAAVRGIATWVRDNLLVVVRDLAWFTTNVWLPSLKQIWQFMNDYVFPILKGIADVISTVLKIAIGVLIIAISSLLDALKPVWTWLDNIFKKVAQDLKPELTWLNEHVIVPLAAVFRDLATTASQVFRALVSDLTSIEQAFPDWLKKLLGISPITPTITYSGLPYQNIPGYATGGVATAGQPAIFGENGPELGIPMQDMMVLSNQYLRQLPASASQITSNMSSHNTSMSSGTVINVGGISISGSGGYSAGQATARGLIETLRARGVTIVGVN